MGLRNNWDGWQPKSVLGSCGRSGDKIKDWLLFIIGDILLDKVPPASSVLRNMLLVIGFYFTPFESHIEGILIPLSWPTTRPVSRAEFSKNTLICPDHRSCGSISIEPMLLDIDIWWTSVSGMSAISHGESIWDSACEMTGVFADGGSRQSRTRNDRGVKGALQQDRPTAWSQMRSLSSPTHSLSAYQTMNWLYNP